MPWWLAVIGIILLILIGVLALSVRLRLIYEKSHRLVGLTLGRRTGLEVNFLTHYAILRLAGIPLRHIDLKAEEEEAPPEEEVRPEPEPEKPDRGRRAAARKRKIATARELAPQILRALWNYLKGLYRATSIEEFGAHIEAGLSSPDRTGQIYGCYQAILGAGPAALARVQFVPVWVGPAFQASGRLVLAIPLYRLVWRTIVLIWQLPIKRIIKLVIARRKGD